MICANFGWNWLSDVGKEDENVNGIQQYHDTNTQLTNFDQPSAQVS